MTFNGPSGPFKMKTEISYGFSDNRFIGNYNNSVSTTSTNIIYPINTLYGFNLSFVSTSSINIQPGTISLQIPSGNYIIVNSTSTLNISSLTTGIGGLDTGSMAVNSWYYVYLIYNETTKTLNSIMSLSSTIPLLPTGYTLYRRIGSVKTNVNTTSILGFSCIGNTSDKSFYWTVFPTTGTTILSGGTAITNTNIPIGTTACSPLASSVFINYQYTANNNVSCTIGITDTSIGTISAIGITGSTVSGNGTIPIVNSQLLYRIFGGPGLLEIVGSGWIESL